MEKDWIDLSMPISNKHVRWKTVIEKKGNFDNGDLFEATQIQVSCHAFTHMDALSHINKGGYNILDINPSTYIGEFYILDLAEYVTENFAITAEVLKSIWPKNNPDKVIFKTHWDTFYSYNSKEFWTKSPYLTEDAVIFMKNKNITIVAFDFPQDYPIRLWVENKIDKPLEKHTTHYHLLSKGVTLVEYICNTKSITSNKVYAVMVPIAIENADGSPCRVLIKNIKE
ncbi:metal-dependent hydrolase [Gallibacterium salpingitidis]|uniref:Metal-dependent hydrolase n=1 Tax=Gallibacterium salpingitidis TaxID=505341 RepID=A0AB36E5C6_9PAST|nr:cyclase family protein [Gallibacterium salpingitidis]OBX06164.1 metal-dependent hydrolase [Gallibacterium salpingitidis]OBX12048.1 metal-dependent hydrolase [Gallibacterium salpingitidis]WKS99915.1 cyclase family protein [Gallibacterium salpingitidis]